MRDIDSDNQDRMRNSRQRNMKFPRQVRNKEELIDFVSGSLVVPYAPESPPSATFRAENYSVSAETLPD